MNARLESTRKRSGSAYRRFGVAIGMGAFLAPALALAHCDGLDGPVVTAAREALKTGNINHVLIWVREKDEPEIRTAFQRTRSVRRLSVEARDLADHYFFETIVRVHRAGEGVPYTGLKPAGRDLGPAIPAADRALEVGDPARLLTLLTDGAAHGLLERFERARAARGFKADNVAAGRAYVERYVEFIHYAERIYEAAARSAHGHFPEEAHPVADHPE